MISSRKEAMVKPAVPEEQPVFLFAEIGLFYDMRISSWLQLALYIVVIFIDRYYKM